MADGQSFILGSFDKDRALCQWNLHGERVGSFSTKHRTESLALSPNGHWLVAMDNESHVYIYNAVTRELEYEIELESRPTSLSISQDSGYLLVNRQDGEIHLYDIANRGNPVRKYQGITGGDYVIRSSFGGADESFVISGSEGMSLNLNLFALSVKKPRVVADRDRLSDGKLSIWHKNIGFQMYKLDAHKPRCNAVCWNPADQCMFASCGDDGKVKM